MQKTGGYMPSTISYMYKYKILYEMKIFVVAKIVAVYGLEKCTFFKRLHLENGLTDLGGIRKRSVF